MYSNQHVPHYAWCMCMTVAPCYSNAWTLFTSKTLPGPPAFLYCVMKSWVRPGNKATTIGSDTVASCISLYTTQS